MSVNHLINRNWWNKRDNLKNKPSLSNRTLHVIDYIMSEEELALGIVIEKLMTTPNLYKETLEKLKSDYPDIE
ncbi:hypothetical protein AFAEC_0581 [Aliarcobacter faecis]|uniref:hypothetical protein n=1 Tax=Aliarcobacter faecis TaxID=1564138 RepID=UPI00047D11D0|nr:hypothetical protein [Aliarcobacter faecis]QKF72772.1 hypothetical protein AFAEC_0581 [Aliarcobacter faecis]